MSTFIRLLTWIDSRVEHALGILFRGLAATLAWMLRRGRHRSWRRPSGQAHAPN
jgi:hypothetical protein